MKSECAWCGKEYTKTHNRQMYCSNACRDYANMEKTNIRVRNHRRKYKEIQVDPLGSYGASLGPTPREDHREELILVEKQLRKFHLK